MTPAKQQLLVTLSAIALLGVASISQADETIERQFNVDPNGTLFLQTDAGKIIVNTHNENTITASVDIEGPSASDFEVSFEQKDNGLHIVGKRDGDSTWNWNNRLHVAYTVTLPQDYHVDVNTSGGSIRIDNLQGNVDARTSGGSIALTDIEGNVDVHTSGGSIAVDDVNGEIDAHTSGGSIKASFSQPLRFDADFTTSGGSIKAYLPKSAAFDIDASTSGGRVKTDFNVDGKVTKRSIRGEINGGGKTLSLDTSGGGIKVIQR